MMAVLVSVQNEHNAPYGFQAQQGACEWAWSPEQIPTTIIGTQDRTAVTVEDAIETDQITDKRDV